MRRVSAAGFLVKRFLEPIHIWPKFVLNQLLQVKEGLFNMNILTAIREEMLIPIHPAGWPFIGLFGVLTLVLGFSFGPFFLIGVPATLWCVYFFRNPERIPLLMREL